MGFDSEFSGALHPSRPLPEGIVALIERSDADLMVMREDDDADGDVGDVVPASRCMHGYDIPHDVLKLQRALDRHGITLSGSIERIGDGGGCYELTEARDGKVYVRLGEIRYGRARRVRQADIMRYAVEVHRDCGHGERRLAGWLAPAPGTAGQKFCLRKKAEGEVVGGRPPYDAAYFTSKDDAELAAGQFRLDGHACAVVGWEETL